MTLLEIITQVTDELGLPRADFVTGSNNPQTRQLLALLNRLGTDLVKQYDWQRLLKEHAFITSVLLRPIVFNMGAISLTTSTNGLSTQFAVSGGGIAPNTKVLSLTPNSFVGIDIATISASLPAPNNIITFSQVDYALPADWDRQIPQTEWDKGSRLALYGPQSSQSWQQMKSRVSFGGAQKQFRIAGNSVSIYPPPLVNGQTFGFEYISKNWIVSSAGTSKQKFTADTDTTIFSDSLLISGLKVKWKAAKGLDATFDLAEFQSLLEQNKSQDHSAKTLSIGSSMDNSLGNFNIPDGNWLK